MADPIATPTPEPTPEPTPSPAPAPTPEPTSEPTPPPIPPTPPAPAEPAKPPEPAPIPEPAKEPEPPKPAEPDYKARAEAMTTRAINAELRAVLTVQGVPEAKLPYAVKLADISGIDLDGKDAGAQIAKAAKTVLDALPELKGTPGVGTGTPMATPRNSKIRDAFQRGFWGDK